MTAQETELQKDPQNYYLNRIRLAIELSGDDKEFVASQLGVSKAQMSMWFARSKVPGDVILNNFSFFRPDRVCLKKNG